MACQSFVGTWRRPCRWDRQNSELMQERAYGLGLKVWGFKVLWQNMVPRSYYCGHGRH